MKKNKFYLLASLLGLLVTTFTVSSLVSASQMDQKHSNFDPELREKHQEMISVLESGDYDAWAELADEKECVKKTDVVTEENFDQFVQMHELMQEGNFEAAKEIRDELGLPERARGMGKGFHKGFGQRGRNLSEPELEQ